MLGGIQTVILTTGQVDQVSHPDTVSVGHVAELGTDGDKVLIVKAIEALVGEDNGTVTASSREAVMERQTDRLASIVGAEAILVDEVVLQLICDICPDLRADGPVHTGIWRANDPCSQEERDESTLGKHICELIKTDR